MSQKNSILYCKDNGRKKTLDDLVIDQDCSFSKLTAEMPELHQQTQPDGECVESTTVVDTS